MSPNRVVGTNDLGFEIDWKKSEEQTKVAKSQGYDFAACLAGRWENHKKGNFYRVSTNIFAKRREKDLSYDIKYKITNDESIFTDKYRTIPLKTSEQLHGPYGKFSKLGVVGFTPNSKSDFTASLANLLNDVDEKISSSSE